MQVSLQKHILIAEDDLDDQVLLSGAFGKLHSDFELVFVQNGLDLVQHFLKYENGELELLPNLVIMDLNMPKKSGAEALAELFDKAYFKPLQKVMFSTTVSEGDRIFCAQHGVDALFEKPGNYSEFLEVVEHFIALAKISEN